MTRAQQGDEAAKFSFHNPETRMRLKAGQHLGQHCRAGGTCLQVNMRILHNSIAYTFTGLQVQFQAGHGHKHPFLVFEQGDHKIHTKPGIPDGIFMTNGKVALELL